PNGTPVRVADLGHVTIGPAARRGIADLDGRGEAVGGIVVMRFGENARSTIHRVKERLADIGAGLPPGVVLHTVYDRSDLIDRSIGQLRSTLIEESIIVALVCLAFLFHAASATVAIVTLPLGVLLAFVAMRWIGVGADIMSLGGIAVAIGAMVDAAVVMIENMHKHLERAITTRGGGEETKRMNTAVLSADERWGIALAASKEVGPALFFSLLIITVSFLPVFALEGQEGRLFKPLAYTKTFAMAAASLLSVTLIPVAMGLFVRGRVFREWTNPLNRVLRALYAPFLRLALAHRGSVVAGAATVVILTWIPWSRLGSEFMPPLDEGSILFMPTTLPGVGVTRVHEILKTQDSILATFPEVARVWGKAGRAQTATDPAGLDMIETTITLKPQRQWRPGMTYEKLIAAMDSAVRMPGVTNAWTMPIRARIDMLATGIRTPVGVKVFGPDLKELERLAREVEAALQGMPGTRSVFAERVASGYYADIVIDRAAIARYGLTVGDVQDAIASAIGGMAITQTVEGRERYNVRVRYLRELRDAPELLANVLVPVPSAGSRNMVEMTGMGASGAAAPPQAQIPLGQLARVELTAGPMVVRTEDAVPTAWIYVDVEGRDIGRYVSDAKERVANMVQLPPGYTLQWSGQYEYMERAKARLAVVIPATLAIVVLLLYFNFKNMAETFMVLLALPFALVGGVWYLWALDYNWSVAVAIGFIALAGVAAETGVVMLLYLDQAWKARLSAATTPTTRDLYEAIVEGALERLRPKMMTVTAIIAGLLPIMWSGGAGASVMKRIAAPMIGGMVSSTVLTLLVLPAAYSLWKEWSLKRGAV
ncbi:MAG TPA: CusA/CzcA family heavy metal efflux RND transporter, partial [Gemmatimonadaceae bacterium]|nr:CusA/CzcA family heavy metal efflux RND transporter [Gemmatimonadaceae bacterium]